MDLPVTVTIAATRSAVKFSLAIRGSVDVGSTADTANDPFGGGPDMPRYVIPGVVGSCAIASAKVSGIPLLLRFYRPQRRGRGTSHELIVNCFAVHTPLPATNVGFRGVLQAGKPDLEAARSRQCWR